ncbi:hypothetical protein BDP27DRAFT_1489680 [Rhodocollybia butyracea]|uniref:Uncharacterized protein n=1 Tax=Rhodocollybia butyracea TaxID=206335 RepID=A0A9P5TZ63_9AGAR|nr:hypothetical protein BDP27DRAFT_1489680 [Rhodocollybia butyracea]
MTKNSKRNRKGKNKDTSAPSSSSAPAQETSSTSFDDTPTEILPGNFALFNPPPEPGDNPMTPGISYTPPQYPPAHGTTLVPTPVTENVPQIRFNFPPTSTRTQLSPVTEEVITPGAQQRIPTPRDATTSPAQPTFHHGSQDWRINYTADYSRQHRVLSPPMTANGMPMVLPTASSQTMLNLEDLIRIQRVTTTGILAVLHYLFHEMGIRVQPTVTFDDLRQRFFALVSTQFDEVLANATTRSFLESVTNYNDVLWMYNLLLDPTVLRRATHNEQHTPIPSGYPLVGDGTRNLDTMNPEARALYEMAIDARNRREPSLTEYSPIFETRIYLEQRARTVTIPPTTTGTVNIRRERLRVLTATSAMVMPNPARETREHHVEFGHTQYLFTPIWSDADQERAMASIREDNASHLSSSRDRYLYWIARSDRFMLGMPHVTHELAIQGENLFENARRYARDPTTYLDTRAIRVVSNILDNSATTAGLNRNTLTITSQSATVNRAQDRPLSPPKPPSRPASGQAPTSPRILQGGVPPRDQARLSEWTARAGNMELQRPKTTSPPIPYATKPKSPPLESTPAQSTLPVHFMSDQNPFASGSNSAHSLGQAATTLSGQGQTAWDFGFHRQEPPHQIPLEPPVIATATTQSRPGFWEQYATTASMYNLPVPVPYEQQQSVQPPRIAVQQSLHQPPVVMHNPQQYFQQPIPTPQSFVPSTFAYSGQGRRKHQDRHHANRGQPLHNGLQGEEDRHEGEEDTIPTTGETATVAITTTTMKMRHQCRRQGSRIDYRQEEASKALQNLLDPQEENHLHTWRIPQTIRHMSTTHQINGFR